MGQESNNRKPAIGEQSGKLPYVPPAISFTEVEVEEALMGFCKATAGGMPTGCSGGCSNPGS